jgi:hypothetical protein
VPVLVQSIGTPVLVHPESIGTSDIGTIKSIGTDEFDDDSIGTFAPLITSSVPIPVHEVRKFSGSGRKEVMGKGKFWIWRTGRGEGRTSKYGGMFSTLSQERKAEYVRNKEKYAVTHNKSGGG